MVKKPSLGLIRKPGKKEVNQRKKASGSKPGKPTGNFPPVGSKKISVPILSRQKS